MPVLFVVFFAETSPDVQFVTASLGNVVTEKTTTDFKKTKKKTKRAIRPENAQSTKKKKTTKKVIVLCSTWTLNVSFSSGSTEKRSKPQFCHCCSFLFNMNIVSCCWNPEYDVAKKEKEKKSNNFQLPVCVFSGSVLISQKWSLSPPLSASICVVCSHLFHIHKKCIPKPLFTVVYLTGF